MLNYEYPPLGGGAANATKYLLKEAVKAGDIEIDLVTSSVNEFEVKELSSKVRVHKLDIGKNGDLHYQSMKDLLKYSWKAYRYSKNLMKKSDYAVCHAFFGIPCGFIAMLLGLPYIVSLRGSDVPFYSERFKWLDRLLFKWLSGVIWRRAKKVVANSGGLKELAHSSHPDIEIDVIPNGVDTEMFAPPENKINMPDGVLRIVSVGRLIERKGFDLLIRSLEGLEKVELVIVGEGPEKENLVTLSDDLGVNTSFLAAVKHSEIPSVYNSSDVFALFSKNEGMSNAMLEAMSSGLPVAVLDFGGVKELVLNKGAGLVLEQSESLSRIKEVMASLSQNFSDLTSSRDIALRFSWTEMFRSYKKSYELYES